MKRTPKSTEPQLWEPAAAEEEAVLFSPERLRKLYNASQVEKIECKREAILMLLGAGWPISRIEQKLHCNFRTVQALAKRYAEEVAGFNLEFAENLLRMAAGWFGLAAVKASDASFKDLTLGAGIALTHARELKLIGLIPEKEATTIDENRVAAAASLRSMMQSNLARQVGNGTLEAEPVTASTPQQVVSCGVAGPRSLNITEDQKPQTTVPPA